MRRRGGGRPGGVGRGGVEGGWRGVGVEGAEGGGGENCQRVHVIPGFGLEVRKFPPRLQDYGEHLQSPKKHILTRISFD